MVDILIALVAPILRRSNTPKSSASLFWTTCENSTSVSKIIHLNNAATGTNKVAIDKGDMVDMAVTEAMEEPSHQLVLRRQPQARQERALPPTTPLSMLSTMEDRILMLLTEATRIT